MIVKSKRLNQLIVFCAFFFAIFSGFSQNNSQEKQVEQDTILLNKMSISLVPLQAQQPTVTNYIVEIDSAKLFYVKVTSDSLLVTHNGKSRAIEVSELASIIQLNKISNINNEIVLIASKTVSYERIKAVIDVFKDEKIFKLQFITRD